jgi:hypothetical protein
MGRDPNLWRGKDYWVEAIYPKNHIDVDHPWLPSIWLGV